MRKISTLASIFSLLSIVSIGTHASAVERLVVMDFGALDTLTELGGQDKVVALPKANIPEYIALPYNSERYISTGKMKEPGFNEVKRVNPDQIIISGRQADSFVELEKIAPVFRFVTDNKNYLDSVKTNVLTLGKMIGKENEAAQKWGQLEEKLKVIKEQYGGLTQKVLAITSNDGKISTAKDKHTLFIHQVLGLTMADLSLGFDQRITVDIPYLQKINPDIIYLVDRGAATNREAFDLDFFKAPELREVNAIKNNKVIYLTPKLWYVSGHGLQSLSLQADEVVAGLEK